MGAGWLAQAPFAHRGLHGAELRENSLEAIAAAVAAGYGIEIDVRIGGDGGTVLSHDEPRGGEPTLAEALAVAADAPLLVELKESAAARPAAELLRGRSRVAVLSFDPVALGRTRRLLPGVPLGRLAGNTEQLRSALRSRADALVLEQRLVSPNQRPVLAWTVTSETEERAARAAGATNVVFEGYRPGG